MTLPAANVRLPLVLWTNTEWPRLIWRGVSLTEPDVLTPSALRMPAASSRYQPLESPRSTSCFVELTLSLCEANAEQPPQGETVPVRPRRMCVGGAPW